ncbi:MAG TPA: hypothetical protein DCW31_10625 [Lactobacillus sp.]|nr:hypothetical protein [Lactobacillus sp.]
MDTIDTMVNRRLDDTFKAYPDSKEMQELREELAADLSEAAHDNEKKGATITDAVNRAFEGLGNLDDLVDEINAENTTPSDDETTHTDEHEQTTHEHHYNHGHHIDISDGKVIIDGGKVLSIDDNGIKVNGGKAVNIDSDGININNGTFTVTDDGIRMGNLIIDDHGIHTDHGKTVASSFKTTKSDDKGGKFDPHANDDTFSDFDQQFNAQEPVDTEIYVDSLALANEQTFIADQVQRINFTYADSTIRILSNPDNDHIIFREYMNRANDSYLAHTDLSNGTLTIHNGSRPHLLPLHVRAQLLLPTAFAGDLLVDAASGSVSFNHNSPLNQVRLLVNSGSLQVNSGLFKDLDINSKSGSVRVKHTTLAGVLRARVHSGSIRLTDTTAAKFDVDAHSGSVRGTSLIGGGAFNTRSGSLNLDFKELTDNLDTTANSSSIKLTFAPGIEYNFDLDAASGSITGPDNAVYDHDTRNFKDGAVGNDPQFYVTAVAKSSSIHVS